MDMKLSDFIEIYFSDKQNDLKDRTIKNKRYMMQQHIVPYFGNQMMSEIKASQIIQWQNEIQKKGYSDSYLRMIQNQLTSLFTHAAKIYDLPVNPCKKVKRMGNSDSRSLNFWTLDEYKQFIQTMEPGTRYYLMFEMLFWTGCRIGELLAITKADINFEKNRLSIIRKSVSGTTTMVSVSGEVTLQEETLTVSLRGKKLLTGSGICMRREITLIILSPIMLSSRNRKK